MGRGREPGGDRWRKGEGGLATCEPPLMMWEQYLGCESSRGEGMVGEEGVGGGVHMLGASQLRNFMATSKPRKHAALAGNALSMTAVNPL